MVYQKTLQLMRKHNSLSGKIKLIFFFDKNITAYFQTVPSCTANGNCCCFHRERVSCFLLRRCALCCSSCSASLASCRSDSRRLISDTTSSRTPPVPFQKGHNVSFSVSKKTTEILSNLSKKLQGRTKTFVVCLDSDC